MSDILIGSPELILKDLTIGTEFKYRGMEMINRITDVGKRTAAYIELDKGDDTSWYNGPPYAIVEHVLDEHGLAAIELTNVDKDKFAKYSAAYIRALVKEKNASRLEHHLCAICEGPVSYQFTDGQVVFDGNCDCPSSGNYRLSSYDDIAAWLAMQIGDDIRDRLLQGLS